VRPLYFGQMTIVRTKCPACGVVEVNVRRVTVRVCDDEGWAAYTFRCPSCRNPVAGSADTQVVDDLVGSGARLCVWRIDADLSTVDGSASGS
jgi:hypothetical protein